MRLQANQTQATPTAAPTTSPAPILPAGALDLSQVTDEQIAFVEDVLSRRYDLYSWCEAKINTLSTVNSILLGILLALTGVVFKPVGWFSTTLLVMCAAAILGSFVVVLVHIIPSMRSGKNPKNERNLRSVLGVSRFETREDYVAAVLASTREGRFWNATVQLYGMNKIVMNNQRAIRWAVVLDLVALMLYVLFATFSFLFAV